MVWTIYFGQDRLPYLSREIPVSASQRCWLTGLFNDLAESRLLSCSSAVGSIGCTALRRGNVSAQQQTSYGFIISSALPKTASPHRTSSAVGFDSYCPIGTTRERFLTTTSNKDFCFWNSYAPSPNSVRF